MAVMVGMVAMLVLIPLAVQLMATNQMPASTHAVDKQEAIEAARAGLSDYINHVQGPYGYLQYCSSGVASGSFAATWTCPNSRTRDSANAAFANSPSDGHWAYVHNVTSSRYAAFEYVVDSANANPSSPAPQQVVVYVTGRAGTATHYIYQTLQATLQVTPAATSYVVANCATGGTAVTVPAGATYALVTATGAQGGAAEGTTAGGGGSGAQVVVDVPVVAGQTWLVNPGTAGYPGHTSLIGLFNPGGRGGGCAGNIDVGGGNGGGALVSLLDGVGGGGGGASAICVEGAGPTPCASAPASPTCTWSAVTHAYTATPCVLVVAGGGGGQGGTAGGGQGGYTSSALTSGAGLPASLGGAFGAAPTPQGAAGQGVLVSALDGLGGGGGGGFAYSAGIQSGGGAGGKCQLLLLVCILAPGGGGGGGQSSAPVTEPGCPAAQTTVASYPVVAGNGGNGQVAITFFTGPVGACTGTAINNAAVAQVVQPAPPLTG